jgi:S1-C subfamily serine protease
MTDRYTPMESEAAKKLTSPPDMDLKELYDGIRPSVVRVTSFDKVWGIPYNWRNGNGFFLKDESLNDANTCRVMTDNHVVAKDDRAIIQTADGKTMSGVVEKRDLDNDLAIIRVDKVKDTAKQCPGLAIADKEGAAFDGAIAVRARHEPGYIGGRVGALISRSNVWPLEILPGENLDRKLLAVSMRGTKPGDSGAVLANSERQVTGLLATEINGFVLAEPSSAMNAFVEDLKRSKQQ